MKAVYATILILFVAVISRCTLPFDEGSFDYERSIVVDGLITDELANHEVSLMYSTPIGNNQLTALEGASVLVRDNRGNEFFFNETGPGTYRSESQFSGQPGNAYQLLFTTIEGSNYQSQMETLIASPPIDSIYDRYAELAPEGAIQNFGGIQFFLDTHDDTGEAQYFRHEWEEVNKIVTPLLASYLWYAQTEELVPNDDTLNICYERRASESLLIGNTLGSTENRLAEYPIRFIPGVVDYLRQRISIKVRQYAISQASHNFYQKFKELNESGGSLFDQQQGAVFGNIRSLNDPDEVVLGNFEVSGVSELRVFFDYEDLDPRFTRPSYRTSCAADNITNITEDSLFSFGQDLRIIRYYMSTRRVDIAPFSCTDCTGYGPTQQPDFWIE